MINYYHYMLHAIFLSILKRSADVAKTDADVSGKSESKTLYLLAVKPKQVKRG